jgi:hypothetical protein
MATFTVSSNANWQDSTFSTRAGNDTYNINGATLTINTDTRYCTNATATTGNIGNATISSTLGGHLTIDSTGVRLIAYISGTGTVPAIGTTITNVSGGITGYLLGVWSAINTTPTAAGAAMPASGFIKVKNTTGSFTSGALSGIGAISSGADVQGWIEVVGVDGGALACPRLGSITINGAWFLAGTTNGSTNQTIQLPASLTNTYYSGVWIETAVGSNAYEFYGNAGSAPTVFATDAVRGKVVWISAQGTCVIAKTSFGGYTPVTGLRVRVPNILLVTCTSGAPTANSYNTTQSSRFKFDTSSGGAISITSAMTTWYNNIVSPYSLTISNSGFLDSLLISSVATSFTIDGCGIGLGTNINAANSIITISTCFAGGTVSNSVFVRYQFGTANQGLNVSTVFNMTVSNCKFYNLVDRTSVIAQGYTQQSGGNLTISNCTVIGGNVGFTSVSNVTINNLTYCDLITGTTTSSNALSAISYSRCVTGLINGVSFGGISNVHPYDGIVGSRDTDHLTIRNIGTPGSPLNLGTSNACSAVFGSSSTGLQAGMTNLRLQNIYVTNLRLGKFCNFVVGDSGITLENCFGQVGDTISGGSQNVVSKALFAGTVPTIFTAVYGSHFFDSYISTTAGNIGLFMNEASSASAAYVSTSLASGSGFTATGSLVMATANDTVTWTWPHYILGYTAFTATAPTVTGTNAAANNKYEYQIDKNDTNGFNGSWKNFYLQKTGGATTNTLATVTMTSTTGIAVGDIIYGTNITAGTRVLSVDSSTQVTMSANSTGTGSGLTFIVSALNGETSISATNGFKLMIRATCTTGSTSNTITGCYCVGTTDASSQLTTYPLDTVNATVTVLNYLGNPIQNARVAIYKTSDNSQLMNTLTDASGMATATISYTSNIPIDIRVRKSSTGTTRYVNNDSVGTITSLGFTSIVILLTDTIASP